MPSHENSPGVGASGLKWAVLLVIFLLAAASCTPNHPYRPAERGADIFYTTFTEPPKHLDPAKAYSSDEYSVLGQIYEPPVQYHYLIRPYRLVPLTAKAVPKPVYYDKTGRRLRADAPPDRVHRAVYEITLSDGLAYQPHPAFASGPDGRPLYTALTEDDMTGISALGDFPVTGTREVRPEDYINQIMRLADPRVESPILSILEKYILGMREFSEALAGELEEVRKARRQAAGAAYNQSVDEKQSPIELDYSAHPFEGVEKTGPRSFRITLKTKYPQFVYWLAMPFFSPMPPEAVRFYSQPVLAERNITLDRYPVGTGPYMVEVNNPNMEMVLTKNPEFRGETYPAEGEEWDREAGLLADAGRTLPLIEKIVFKLEKEAIPRWNKFLQGYYDSSGLTSESFDQAVTISTRGDATLTDAMREKGIRLITSVQPSTYYAGFNMLDDVVGGYGSSARKLRQAIAIAIDYEEYIEIFNNGRGIPAMGPLPPGIFGHLEGREGANPFVYRWDEARGRPERRSIEYARELMRKAGYPEGRDSEGRPLVVTFDNPWNGPQFTPMINWYMKKFKLLGIQLENRTTDYNRFREKMLSGNFQFFVWGWNADYPDPENFFFLLAGDNSKVKFGGENVANYSNPEFDRLFRRMENMDNTPARLAIIERMTRIAQEDSPWVWGYHPVAFGLFHAWVANVKSNAMANNTMKYYRIEAGAREERRRAWNRPVLWPLAALAAVLIAASVPAVVSARRKKV
ncbi:MAG: ABC transporter substrate-binding protein [Thermodesulfobacteriota bacterium]